MTMSVCRIFLACLLSITASQVLAEQQDTSRYSIVEANGGAIRLDRKSGAISNCQKTDNDVVCTMADDDRDTLTAANNALEQRVEALERRVEELEATNSPPSNNRSNEGQQEETVSKTEPGTGMVEAFLRRFAGLVKKLRSSSATD